MFKDDGTLIRSVTIAGSSQAMLGLGFNPVTHQLLVIDFGAGKVLNVNPHNGNSSVFMTVTGSSGLNALTFDAAGNVYVSDSFQGIIWTTGPHGGAGTVWKQDPLLTTTGTPPFGANGIAFNRARSIMFVANTGNDTLVQIAVSNVGGTLTAGAASVFTNSINGADGIVLDANDNIWVAANQADEIVVVDPTGQGDRQARRLQWRREWSDAGTAVSGKPRLQQGRRIAVGDQPGTGFALDRHHSVGRLAMGRPGDAPQHRAAARAHSADRAVRKPDIS